MASEEIWVAFLENAVLMGMPYAVRERFPEILRELDAFLGTPASTWRRLDLERFLKLRAPSLRPEERSIYGVAMGVLTELIEREYEGLDEDESEVANYYVTPATSVRRQVLALDRPETAVGDSVSRTGRIRHQTTDFLGETLKRIEGRGATTARAARPRLMPGERAHSGEPLPPPLASPPADELAHASTQAQWAQPLHDAKPAPNPFGDRPRSGQTPTGGVQPGLDAPTPSIEIGWRRELGIAVVSWAGFVLGDRLRWALDRVHETLLANQGERLLIDMREARIISQNDTDWFGKWLADCRSRGIGRIAIVLPQRVIARMQMQRLQPGQSADHKLEGRDLALFDDRDSALVWLCARA